MVQHSLQSISYVLDVLSKKYFMLSAQQLFFCIFLHIRVSEWHLWFFLKPMNWMRHELYKKKSALACSSMCHEASRSLYRHQSFRPVFKRTISSFFCRCIVNQFIINVDRRSVHQLYFPPGYPGSSKKCLINPSQKP